MTILVTGGAGYIGSHTVRQLVGEGHEIVVLDNLVYGHREAIVDETVTLVEGDLGDFISVISRVLFIMWGLMELFWGVNTWRRILGVAVILFVLL